MKKISKLGVILLGFFPFFLNAQCLEGESGIIWKGKESMISFEELALHAAPMLWFSPDEIKLYNAQGKKQLPNAFPFEEQSEKPVVYYKLRHVFSQNSTSPILNEESNNRLKLLNLKEIKALDLDYYYYFLEETGLGSHPHDIESVSLQIEIIQSVNCPDFKYAIKVTKVTARAHGVHWFNNVLEVDAQTFFPLSILIEEGKHASCTDKNADGIYTPTYDVTEKVNDAWGVRDIITSGRLVTGGFQSWMAKSRAPNSIVFPPIPASSPHYKKYQEKFGKHLEGAEYDLRPYPDYLALKAKGALTDEKLENLMVGKKPHNWPNIEQINGKGVIKRWAKQSRAANSISVAYRWDDSQRLSFALPLLLVKNVEAPMTGGWLYHKLYGGDLSSNSFISESEVAFVKLMGHQIVHSASASRWIDTYVGLGYEIFDVDFDPVEADYKFFFASEAGIKIRLNISHTPLKFLRKLGTNYWGLRLGWKNVGFNPFVNSGFVVEFGAGAF